MTLNLDDQKNGLSNLLLAKAHSIIMYFRPFLSTHKRSLLVLPHTALYCSRFIIL